MGKIAKLKDLAGSVSESYLMYLPAEANRERVKVYCLDILREALEKRKAELEEKLGKKLEISIVSKEEFDRLTGIVGERDEREISLGVETGILIGDPLNHSYTLGDYVVASCNREAYELLKWVASRPGEACGVVIYGKTGVGKSHLIQGFAWASLFKTQNVAFFRAQSFIDLVLKLFSQRASVQDAMSKVVNKCHWILIDDFQFLTPDKLGSVREVFFSLTEQALSRGRKVVVTSDVKPDMWQNVHPRLAQRLTLTGCVAINPPDSEFVVTYIREKLKAEGRNITEDALKVVEKLSFSSVRELHRLVTALLLRGVSVVDEAAMLSVVGSLYGSSVMMRPMIEDRLFYAWKQILSCFFDPYEVQEILAGREGMLESEAKKVLKEVKTGFVCAVHGIYPASKVCPLLGVGRSTFYRLLSRGAETPVARAAMREAEKLLGEGEK